MWLRMNYEELTNKELLNIISEVKKELNYRKAKLEETIKEADILTDTVEFEFYEVGKYNWVPYVARCTYSKIENDGIKRVFKSLDKTKSDNEVVVAGKWKASELQVYDIRRSKARKYYILLNGELIEIGNPMDAQQVARVKQYLKGDIGLEALLELNGLKEIIVEVMDELKD